MGIFYIVGAPSSDPEDVTCRALRVLRAVDLIAAADIDQARRLLSHWSIATPLVAANRADTLLAALAQSDVALLTTGWEISPAGPAQRFIRSALERGFPVKPVPGPALPISALVVSGLPADSFVYLGQLPDPPAERSALLAAVATERRTLVALETPHNLMKTLRSTPPRGLALRASEAVANLSSDLGNRPLVIAAEADQRIETIWRGTLGDVPVGGFAPGQKGPCVLVIGGATEQATRWTEDQLRAELQACLEQDRGVKEISRQLAAESGWPRREIYRLGVEMNRTDPPDRDVPLARQAPGRGGHAFGPGAP